LSQNQVSLDKEVVIKDLEHLLKEGHGELVVKVADHKIVDIKYDIHRIISNKGKIQSNS